MSENLSYVKSRLRGSWGKDGLFINSAETGGPYGGLTVKMAPTLYHSLHTLLAKSGFNSSIKRWSISPPIESGLALPLALANKMIQKCPHVSSKSRSPKTLCASPFSSTPETLPGEWAWGTRWSRAKYCPPNRSPRCVKVPSQDQQSCLASLQQTTQPRAISTSRAWEQNNYITEVLRLFVM